MKMAKPTANLPTKAVPQNRKYSIFAEVMIRYDTDRYLHIAFIMTNRLHYDASSRVLGDDVSIIYLRERVLGGGQVGPSGSSFDENG